MKKFLVVLLILVVAGGVFAQELKLSGLLNSGLQLNVFDGDTKQQSTVGAYAYDAGQNGYRFRLNGAFTMGNMGVNFRFQSQGGTSNQAANIAFAYGYVNLFDGMINLNGGVIDNGTYNSMGDWDSDGGEGTGALINIRPIKDLSIGLGIYADAKGTAAPATAWDVMKFTGNVAFTMPDLFKLTAVYAMDNLQSYTPPGGSSVTVKDYKQISAGLSILAVKNLKFIIEGAGRFYEVPTGQKYTPGMVVETISYKIDKLDFGIIGYEYFNGRPFWSDNPDKKNPAWNDAFTAATTAGVHDISFGFTVEPWISYTINGNIVPKLAFKYGMDNLDRDGTQLDMTLTEMRIKPSIRFNLPMSSWIELAYEFYYVTASGKTTTGASIADFSRNLNRVYVDFVWKF